MIYGGDPNGRTRQRKGEHKKPKNWTMMEVKVQLTKAQMEVPAKTKKWVRTQPEAEGRSRFGSRRTRSL